MEKRVPKIQKAILIDERRIEIYWLDQMRYADDEKNFKVLFEGKEQPLVHWTAEDEWGYGTVYQKEHLRTTICMEKGIDVNEADKIELFVSSKVTDLMDIPVDEKTVWKVTYEPHYTQVVTGKSGVMIKASKKVQADTLVKAAELVDIMLEKIPQVAKELQKRNVFLSIFGIGESAYDVPEHRMGYLLATRPVEGFGGDVASVSEANVIRRKYGRYATAYPNESILAHEFGHSIHLSGINELKDQSLAKELEACYEHASSTGLFPNTYAISNSAEYFATMCTFWFNVMQEGADGTWDGVRGPVNTREELKEYDPMGYKFMKKLFNEVSFPTPWDQNRDAYHIDGTVRE